MERCQRVFIKNVTHLTPSVFVLFKKVSGTPSGFYKGPVHVSIYASQSLLASQPAGQADGKPANQQAGEQGSEPAKLQVSRPGSQQAMQQASKPASQQNRKMANKQASQPKSM